MPTEIHLACSGSGSAAAATYVMLHTTIDLDGMYDLIEMNQVNATWETAAQLNAHERATGDAVGGR